MTGATANPPQTIEDAQDSAIRVIGAAPNGGGHARYVDRIPDDWRRAGEIVGVRPGFPRPSRARTFNSEAGPAEAGGAQQLGIVTRGRPRSARKVQNKRTPAVRRTRPRAPKRPPKLVERFKLIRQLVGRVRDIEGDEFLAVFSAPRGGPDEGRELVARFRISEVLTERQQEQLAVGLVFDLVTGRRLLIDRKRRKVVRSALETRIFFRRPRTLSEARLADAHRRAEEALAADG